jgi:hypothetical protein
MSQGSMPGLPEQPLRPRTEDGVARLPVVLVPQPGDDDERLQYILTELALQRAWGQISQRDFEARRAIARGLAPSTRPTLRQRWARLRAARDEPRVVLTLQPQPGDDDERLQYILAELALQRAWGQISQHDFTAQRTVVLSLRRHLYGPASSRMGATRSCATTPSLEVQLAELGRQRAFGQISLRAFEARRASLLRPRDIASPRLSKYWRAAQDEARVSWTPQRLRGAASAKRSPGHLLEWSGVARAGGSWLAGLRVLLRRLATSRDVAVLLPLLAGVGVVQATNMLHWPGVFFDEGTYVSWAWAVRTHGALSNYTYSYGHPPLAWLLISLWTWASGIFGHAAVSVDEGRGFMLVVTIVSCALLYTLARRLGIGRVFAAGAVLLFALSPLALYFHRLVLLDNPAIAWLLGAFVLARTPRRRLWAFAGSGACFAAAVLSKETTLVLLPALLLAAAQNSDQRTRRYCLTLFTSFFGLIALAYPLYAALKGELLLGSGHVSLFGATIVQLVTRKATGSVFDPQSLSHGVVASWLQLDPWLVGAGLLLSPIALLLRNTRAAALAFLIQAAIIFRPGYLPAMYVIGLLPFSALIVAGCGDALWRRHVRSWHLVTGDHRLRNHLAGRSRWPPFVAWASLGAAAVAIAASTVVVGLVAPDWTRSDQVAATVRLDDSQRAAEQWLVQNVGHDKRLIVDDGFWIYLVEHGFNADPMTGGFYSRTVVSYWPLDYDPGVRQHFPDGWRDFDYIVSTDSIRGSVGQTPTAALALEHSRVVASFGQGGQLIEIRQITGAQG